MKTFIYSLSGPDGIVRYIGKSNTPRKRLHDHIKECSGFGKSHKISWIKSLLFRGERPTIEIIEEVTSDEWEYWEMYWIQQFKSWGFNLVNSTIGGEGGSGYKHTKESRSRMSLAKSGLKLSDEQKVKISNSVKDKFISNPNYNKCSDLIHEIDRDELYKMYITENLSLNKCAIYFNVSPHTIFRNVKKSNIKKDKEIWKKQLSTKPKKVVHQYDLSGVFIREWDSPSTIKKELNISVENCCRGLVKSCHGYIWVYRDDMIDIKPIAIKPKINQYDMLGNYISEFKSIGEASKLTGISRSPIWSCCSGKYKSAGGFIWRYN